MCQDRIDVDFLSLVGRCVRKLWSISFRKILPDRQYLSGLYFLTFGRRINWKSPKSFNEKIQWLKLNTNKNKEFSTYADKYKVRQYVSQKIDKEILVPLLGVWDRFDEINFDSLPEKFVLKTNSDSGSVLVCQNKSSFDKKKARRKLERSLRRNYYWNGREYPYKYIERKIICEKYIGGIDHDDVRDYKFMCFNGKVMCVFVCTDRNSNLKITIFDKDWNCLPFRRKVPVDTKKLEKPSSFEKMIEIAEKLSEGFPFIRVDLYDVEGQIYFGETTFHPGGGLERFFPEKWDYILGEWLELPKIEGTIKK